MVTKAGFCFIGVLEMNSKIFKSIRKIEDREEKLDQLYDITNFWTSFHRGRREKDSFRAWLVNCLIDNPTCWYEVILKTFNEDEWAELYEKKYGYWNHGGSRDRMIGHNRHGMAFAWWAKEFSNHFHSISLRDSPDFSGRLLSESNRATRAGHKVYGDIGKCTGTPFINLLRNTIGIHDVWVSSFGHIQIVIEFSYNVYKYNQLKLEGEDNVKKMGVEKVRRELFTCHTCGSFADGITFTS